ncbi:hypothetical protein NTJ28_002647 [Flavobacterium psychrophilum]|nr:hypothetical protein [Flavobacterium psychrophilum]
MTNNSDTKQCHNATKPLLQDGFSRSIDDLEGEIWIDAIGFDGTYEVSNLGRVKSLGRWVNNGNSGRFVKERILSIAKCKSGHATVNLSINNITTSKVLNQLIYYSFNPDKINDSLKNEIAHLNKNSYDNRLCNLQYFDKKGSSYKISMELGNVKHLEKARKELWPYTKKNGVFENGVLIEKKCKKCNCIKKTQLFEKSRNTCKECRYTYIKVSVNDSASQTIL